MKKHYFNSISYSIVYLIIALVLSGFIVICFMADEIHTFVIFCITFLAMSVIVILFWFGFSLSMRIQIDYINKELYIRHPYYLRKIKFEDIISIEIIDYNEIAFEFYIITKKDSKKIPYARYLNRRPNEKITLKLNEIKCDLLRISNKEY